MAGGESRERLLEEGLRLLLRDGYSATGLKSIVDAADVPKGSFYYFFPAGKEHFAAEVVDLYAARASRVRREVLLEPVTPPVSRIRDYFESYAKQFQERGFREGCLLGNLSAEVADASQRIRARIHEAFTAWEADLAQVVGEAMERGDIPRFAPPKRVARYLIHSWEGALLRMKSEKSSAALEEFLTATFEVLLAPRGAS